MFPKLLLALTAGVFCCANLDLLLNYVHPLQAEPTLLTRGLIACLLVAWVPLARVFAGSEHATAAEKEAEEAWARKWFYPAVFWIAGAALSAALLFYGERGPLLLAMFASGAFLGLWGVLALRQAIHRSHSRADIW